MKKYLSIAAAALALTAVSSSANAATILSQSFESANVGSYAYANQAFGGSPSVPVASITIPGVTFNGATGIQKNGSAWGFASAPDGVQTAFIQSYNGVGGSIQLALSGLQAGSTYTVTFDAAARGGYGVNPFSVTTDGSSAPFNVANTTWALYTTTFVASSSTDTLTFTGSSGTAGDLGVGIDNITVSGPVPEPATWALMLLGFGMVGYAMRKRSQRVSYTFG